MTGYSPTPQTKKLGIKPGCRFALDQPPQGWSLEDHQIDSRLVDLSDHPDLIISFYRHSTELDDRLAELARLIHPSGALWVAWPRRAAGHDSDITDNEVRRRALPLGIVDVKVAAIDEDWSGLRFVWRRERRS